MTGALHAVVTDQDVSPGVLGFLMVAAIGVATYFLIRSMRRQLQEDRHPRGRYADPPRPTLRMTRRRRPRDDLGS